MVNFGCIIFLASCRAASLWLVVSGRNWNADK